MHFFNWKTDLKKIRKNVPKKIVDKNAEKQFKKCEEGFRLLPAEFNFRKVRSRYPKYG